MSSLRRRISLRYRGPASGRICVGVGYRKELWLGKKFRGSGHHAARLLAQFARSHADSRAGNGSNKRRNSADGLVHLPLAALYLGLF